MICVHSPSSGQVAPALSWKVISPLVVLVSRNWAALNAASCWPLTPFSSLFIESATACATAVRSA